MSTPTIFANPPDTSPYYLDPNSYVSYESMVLRSIRTLRDEQNVPQTLYVGASSNVDVEVENNVRFFTSNGSLQYYWASFSNNQRTDRLGLQISESNDAAAYVLSSDAALILSAGDPYHTIQLGGIHLHDSNDGTQFMDTTSSNGLRISSTLVCDSTVSVLSSQQVGQNLAVGNDVNVGRNLSVQDNVFAQSLALLKTKQGVTTSNAVDQVGYAFRITDRDQLEIVRYARFFGACNPTSSNPLYVTQRVGLFGNGNVSATTPSDVAFTAYEDVNGTGVPAVNSNGAASGGGSVNIASVWGTNYQGNLFYNGGLVGIGKTTPEYELDINGSIKSSSIAATQSMVTTSLFVTAGTNIDSVLSASSGSNSTNNNATMWNIDDSGNVYFASGLLGVNTSAPQYQLDVNGTTRTTNMIVDSNVSALELNVSGQIQAVNISATETITCASYYSTSDARLKTVIGASDVQDCYTKVLQTNVVSYTFNNDAQQRPKTGFIAQELEVVMPDAVFTTSNDLLSNCKFIEPNVVLGYAMGAIQHGAKLQADTQNQISSLQTQMDLLIMTLRRLRVLPC
jgi:hypothetical protein